MSGKTIAIVGAGPSGLFAAVELCRAGLGNKVAIFDKGKDLNSRACPAQANKLTALSAKTVALQQEWGVLVHFLTARLLYPRAPAALLKLLE